MYGSFDWLRTDAGLQIGEADDVVLHVYRRHVLHHREYVRARYEQQHVEGGSGQDMIVLVS
jgi:hypothetical protein